MKQIPFKVRGMQKDLAESSFNPQYAYDIKNMRIMATNDNTLMSLVNEKGPKQLPITWHDSTATPPDSEKTNYFFYTNWIFTVSCSLALLFIYFIRINWGDRC